jgi:hypothetical protein
LRKKLIKWLRWTLLFLAGWLVIFFFLFGPGRVLFPKLLISYSNVTDKTNTVYYSGDKILEALDVLWMAARVQDSIKQFWGPGYTDEFEHGVSIFVCESPDQYMHLTWNKAMGSAIMGRIVLNPKRFEGTMSLYSALVHEMTHLYMNRRYGFVPNVFFVPKWFDEGCATAMQDYSYAAMHMNDYLDRNPELPKITSLRHPWNWQTMVRMEQGRMTGKGYGMVYGFMHYLLDHYGREKVRVYASKLGWNVQTDRSFKTVFGVSLEEATESWKNLEIEQGNFPGNTQFIALPFDVAVCIKWLLIALIVIGLPTWLVWWLVRKIRKIHVAHAKN